MKLTDLQLVELGKTFTLVPLFTVLFDRNLPSLFSDVTGRI